MSKQWHKVKRGKFHIPYSTSGVFHTVYACGLFMALEEGGNGVSASKAPVEQRCKKCIAAIKGEKV